MEVAARMKSFSQSPADDGFVQNPYPFYERARQAGDLFHWVEYDRVCAVSYRAVNALLRDRRWGREIPGEFRRPVPEHLEPFMKVERHSMLELDPPEHTRLRGLVSKAFTTRRVSDLAPAIENIAEELLRGLDGDCLELQKAYAERLPVLVIAGMLGVPASMAGQLLEWSHRMVAVYQAGRNRSSEEGAAKAASEFSEFIRREVRKKRKRPTDDLISSLISAEEGGGKLTEDEMASTCILLLNAGHEATAYSIGNGIKAIIESGRRAAELVSPEAVAATVEEILRFDPPLHMFERHAKQDLEAFGRKFKRGDTVALLLGAANRDPDAFPDPGSFKPGRRISANVAFGAGIHFCVGAPLARLEIATALQILFSRFPELRFAEAPRYADRYHFHGPEKLAVRP